MATSLTPLECFLPDPIPDDGIPCYDVERGSQVLYADEGLNVVQRELTEEEDGQIKVPLIDMGADKAAELAEWLLAAAAASPGSPGGGTGEVVTTTARGRAVRMGEPHYVTRMPTKDGRTGLLVYNPRAVAFGEP